MLTNDDDEDTMGRGDTPDRTDTRRRLITHRLVLLLRKPSLRNGTDVDCAGGWLAYWKVSKRKNICVSVTFTIISSALDLPFIQSLLSMSPQVAFRPSAVARLIE